ncbi:eCIS core domain-containing protein [Candidatus Nitrososphaera gargensis]|uniref:eCIS core domain-containing protein n=1 Tax=Candidatus Nitrososphaera gargensis TaxID=497727 RepID=UPI003898F049
MRGDAAARSTRSINALAYTVGSSIIFGAGQYKPYTFDGMQLLAHELTHMVQNSLRHLTRQNPRPAIIFSTSFKNPSIGKIEIHSGKKGKLRSFSPG